MSYTFNHGHLKGLDPTKSARWYADAFGARVLQEDYITSDDSLSSIIDLDGIHFVVTGPPPGGKLTPGDTSELGFYTGGLRYGLDHFALASPRPLEESLKELIACGAEVLLAPRVNRYGAKTCFIKGPDDLRIEIVEHPHFEAAPTGYTISHFHLKGLDPATTATWYTRAFGAEVLQDDYVMSDESPAFILKMAGLRFFVSGPPPGKSLARGDASELGFYTGGLRYGLDHFAIDLNAPLDEGLKRLTEECGAEVLLAPRVNRYGLRNCFIKGPDDTRIELVEYPMW